MVASKSLKKKSSGSGPEAGKRDMIKGKENLLIEKEKRYQREVRGPQVEKQTLLKETKKKPAPKVVAKKKS
jgi:hypothetical protein